MANICWIIEKPREFQKNTALLTMPKPLTVWITINCGKFWKRWEYQTTWPTSWEKCLLIFTNSYLDLHSHLQWMKVLSTTSSPTDNIAWLINCCQSGECEIMPHSSLKLQFLGHQRVWASLNIYLPFICKFCKGIQTNHTDVKCWIVLSDC